MARRTLIRMMVGLGIGIVLTGGALYASRHRLGDAVEDLHHVRWAWVGVALGAEVVSMGAFARMQRRLLNSGGLPISMPIALAVTYAGNAVAMTLPIAGSATGTGFTFRRWVQRGADPAMATWSLLMAGIFSGSSLAIVGGIGGLLAGNVATGILGAVSTLLGIAPFVVVLVAVRRPRWRQVTVAIGTVVVSWVLALRRRPRDEARDDVEAFLDRLATVRLGSRAGLETAGFALLNWVADIGCLAACVAAFGVSIPWSRLVLLYMAGIGAATFNLTPAGIGVVEVAIAAAAASVGIAKRDAMAAALLYRGVSSWLIIAAGWVVFAALRRSRLTTIEESLDEDEVIGDVVVIPAFGAGTHRAVPAGCDGSMAVACAAVSAGE